MTIAVTDRMEIAVGKETGAWGSGTVSSSRLVRISGQNLNNQQRTIQSDEMSPDRMVSDLILVDEEAVGNLSFELSYLNADTIIESLLFSTWVNTPEIENATAASSISDVAGATGIVTVASGGDAFKAGHLAQLSGFTNAANNKVLKVTDSAAGSITFGAGAGLVDEGAPPAGAKIKVVGVEGGAGEFAAVTAGGNGISRASGAIDFTTLGLAPGMWVKIGDATEASSSFQNTACNGWARISGVAADKISFDVVPSGWAADAGAGKSIRIWFGDYLKNGVTRTPLVVERRHLDINQFFLFSGMIPGTGAVSLRSGAIATLSIDWLGKIGTRKDQASLQNPKPAPTADVMNCAGDVLQIVGGADDAVASMGTLQTFMLNMSNNLRGIKGIGIVGNADVKEGQFAVTGSFEAYFEDGTIFDAAKNQTPWDLAFVLAQDNQAYVWDAPKTKFTAEIVAGQRNQDCVVRASFQALKEAALGACVVVNRLPYYR